MSTAVGTTRTLQAVLRIVLESFGASASFRPLPTVSRQRRGY